MGCSTPDTRAVNFPAMLTSSLGVALPGITCGGGPLYAPAEAAPAVIYNTDICAQDGSASVCSTVPAGSVQRLCYCRPKCPRVPPLPTGTTAVFLYEGTQLDCLAGPCPSGTVARYSCSPNYAFSNQLGVRGGFQASTCTSGTWSAGVAACIAQQPGNVWVISPLASSCDTACRANGMACSLPEPQAVSNNVTDVLGDALPGLTCSGILTLQTPGAGPALDHAADTCAQSGAVSTCEAVSGATEQRLCYCRPECPPPAAPLPDTEVQFLYYGQTMDCLAGNCPSWTQARYKCTNGKVFANQQSLRGGWQTTTCVSGTWRGKIAACVESQLVNTWVISPAGTGCGASCSSQGMNCSAPAMRSMTTPEQLAKVVGSAVPWLSCDHTGDADSQDAFEPAVDLTTSQCYATGQGSSCDTEPNGDVRRLW